ncbi:hypothetical protein NCAS_0B03000 [Naumovozyma castellii]|uniref:Ketopantoate reductase C-terminal domain-containing protein n=1 Tax=Naumovozyma castellii TaxID=27288 RepID=G0VBQ8_NAUCA|nr:hypothetical protein NCAS_0B03000 [Naumovozyma castellii CBS 4309]CCC68384.1 hypothetical protein NCAS_0B03000 [Naumovozyma castellii CBS 4309]
MATIPRLYTLGNSAISPLIASEIAKLPTQPKVPKIVLLLQDQKQLQRFLDGDSKISIHHKGEIPSSELQFMASCNPPIYSTGEVATIDNLLVAEHRAKSLTSSLTKYKKSISPTTNVMLVNPPFGSIEYLYEKVWKQPSIRPNLFIGMTKVRNPTHIAKASNEFHVNVRKNGLSMFLSPIPRDLRNYNPLLVNEQDMMKENEFIRLLKETESHSRRNTLESTPLEFVLLPFGELLLFRLERLIVDSCIESLSLLYDCQYSGELLMLVKATELLRRLIKEQVKILKIAYPSLSVITNSSIALDQDRLYNLIIDSLKKSSNQSKASRLKKPVPIQSNIDELCGYFVRLAYSNNIDCKWNEMLKWLVKGKLLLAKHRRLDYHYL